MEYPLETWAYGTYERAERIGGGFLRFVRFRDRDLLVWGGFKDEDRVLAEIPALDDVHSKKELVEYRRKFRIAWNEAVDRFESELIEEVA